MNKRLYVGNLSYSVDNAELEEAFSQFGAVQSATVIVDRMTDRSKGFGFVEFADEEEARNAIEGMNGQEHRGRTLRVDEARPRPDRDRRSDDGFNSW